MNTVEVCRKFLELGSCGRRTLVYSLIQDDSSDPLFPFDFGFRVQILETFEVADCRHVTPVLSRAEQLLDLIASGSVTPLTLSDVVYDLLD